MTILITARNVEVFNDKLSHDSLVGMTFEVVSAKSTPDYTEVILRDSESMTVSHTLLTNKNGKVCTVKDWQTIALDGYKRHVREVLDAAQKTLIVNEEFSKGEQSMIQEIRDRLEL